MFDTTVNYLIQNESDVYGFLIYLDFKGYRWRTGVKMLDPSMVDNKKKVLLDSNSVVGNRYTIITLRSNMEVTCYYPVYINPNNVPEFPSYFFRGNSYILENINPITEPNKYEIKNIDDFIKYQKQKYWE